MDSKTTIQAVVAMLIALTVWFLAAYVLLPPTPRPETPDPGLPSPGAAEPRGSQRPDEAEAAGDRISPQTSVSAAQSAAPAEPSEFDVPDAERGAPVFLGEASTYRSGPYRMQVELDPRGAAIRRVLLTDFLQNVTPKDEFDRATHFQLVQPVVDESSGVEYLSLPTRAINILTDGKPTSVILDRVNWAVGEHTVTDEVQTVSFRVPVRRDGREILEIEKGYELPSESYESGRHDLRVSLSVRNTGTEPVDFFVEQGGPTGVIEENKRTDERYVFAGLIAHNKIQVERRPRRELHKQAWRVENTSDRPLAWMTLANKYFMFLMSPGEDEGQVFGDLIARAEAITHLSSNGREAGSDLAFRFVSTRQTLRPGEELTFQFACYAGPKARTGLENNPDYLARHYVSVLDAGYTWCTFVGLAKLMTALLNLLYRVLGNYGLAIIVLVLIVRTLLHPITKKGQVNMVKMQEQMSQLQPKMEEIKKKYANDKVKMNQATMELYREAGLSPAGQMLTCLPMFLQMPIWVALWTSLNYTVEMRHQPFFLWIRDLTGTDSINTWFGWHFQPFNVPILSGMIGPIDSLNVLPLILSATMYFQQRFMPKPSQANKRAGKTADQLAQQQKIMNFMLVFFGVLFYNAPAGLNLYIMSSNIFGMIEQWRIRKHIAVEKERGKFAPAPRKPSRNGKPGIWGRLERMAADARRVQSNRPGRRRTG